MVVVITCIIVQCSSSGNCTSIGHIVVQSFLAYILQFYAMLSHAMLSILYVMRFYCTAMRFVCLAIRK